MDPTVQIIPATIPTESEQMVVYGGAEQSHLSSAIRTVEWALRRNRAAIADLRCLRHAGGNVGALLECGNMMRGERFTLPVSIPAELVRTVVDKELESRRAEYRKALIELRDAAVEELEGL